MRGDGGIPNRTTISDTYSPLGGGQSDTVNINNKIQAANFGEVVLLGPGTYTLGADNWIMLNKSGIVVRGSGPGVTIIEQNVNTGTPAVQVGSNVTPSTDANDSIALHADPTADGSNATIVVENTGNVGSIVAGDLLLLDERSGAAWADTDGYPGTPVSPFTKVQVWRADRYSYNMHLPLLSADDINVAGGESTTVAGPQPAESMGQMGFFSRYDRCANEIKEVSSITNNGNGTWTIVFTSPLIYSYRVSHTAQICRYTGAHAKFCGLENLTVKGGQNSCVGFSGAAHCWAKNIEVTLWVDIGFFVGNSFRVECQGSYIHHTYIDPPVQGGGCYGFGLYRGASEILIENSISYWVNKNIVVQACGAGSVVGYSYFDGMNEGILTSWQEVSINASHSQGSHHVLFEGNLAPNADQDMTHGSSHRHTMFRNWLTGKRRDFPDDDELGNKRCAGAMVDSFYMSYVGNVLGRSGQMANWTLTAPGMNCDANGANCTGGSPGFINDDHVIWKIGYDIGDLRYAYQTNSDLMFCYRDGNWAWLPAGGGRQDWYNDVGGDRILPDSLYRPGSKPDFFGTLPWPWVDPSTGATGTLDTSASLPAKRRFEAGTPNDLTPPGGGETSGSADKVVTVHQSMMRPRRRR